MGFQLIEMSKNTRGKESREIKFLGIGREVKRTIQRETNEDGSPITEKNEDGTLKTRPEEVTELTSDGVLTSLDDALELVGGDTQRFLDYFAFGFNRAAYQAEADKDELDVFTEGLDEAAAKARKSAIRALAKTLGIGIMDAGSIIKDAAEATAAAKSE